MDPHPSRCSAKPRLILDPHPTQIPHGSRSPGPRLPINAQWALLLPTAAPWLALLSRTTSQPLHRAPRTLQGPFSPETCSPVQTWDVHCRAPRGQTLLPVPGHSCPGPSHRPCFLPECSFPNPGPAPIGPQSTAPPSRASCCPFSTWVLSFAPITSHSSSLTYSSIESLSSQPLQASSMWRLQCPEHARRREGDQCPGELGLRKPVPPCRGAGPQGVTLSPSSTHAARWQRDRPETQASARDENTLRVPESHSMKAHLMGPPGCMTALPHALSLQRKMAFMGYKEPGSMWEGLRCLPRTPTCPQLHLQQGHRKQLHFGLQRVNGWSLLSQGRGRASSKPFMQVAGHQPVHGWSDCRLHISHRN